MFRKYWCLFEMTSKQDKSAKIFYTFAATNYLALFSCFIWRAAGVSRPFTQKDTPAVPAITDAAQ